ncbi:MAG: hypothetical protein AB7O52_11400 [Planctomycetota bacterium]
MRLVIRGLCAGALWVGLASGSGCVLSQTTQGSGLEDTPYAQLIPGQSTRADVTRLLGPPDEVVHSNREHDPLFERAFLYKRSRSRQTAMFLILFSTHRSDTKYDSIAVFFDDQGVVEHVGSRLQARESSYGMPW